MGNEPLTPQPTADTKEFWEACRNKRLCFQQCEACGYIRWPFSNLCPVCHSFKAHLIESSGKGRLISFVVYHVAFHPNWKDKIPYITAIVELEEGPRIITNIVDATLGELSCDMPVEIVWEKAEDYFIPKFRPMR